jgi:hypothetical protein
LLRGFHLSRSSLPYGSMCVGGVLNTGSSEGGLPALIR